MFPRCFSFRPKTLARATQAENCHVLKGLKVLFQNVSQRMEGSLGFTEAAKVRSVISYFLDLDYLSTLPASGQ